MWTNYPLDVSILHAYTKFNIFFDINHILEHYSGVHKGKSITDFLENYSAFYENLLLSYSQLYDTAYDYWGRLSDRRLDKDNFAQN